MGGKMQFRVYVPRAVQKFCTVEIEQWAPLITEADQKLAAIETAITRRSEFCEACQLENSPEDYVDVKLAP